MTVSIVRRSALRLACALVMLLAAVGAGRAELRIDITRGVVEPMPIAIVPFDGDNAESQQLGRNISSVVSADLERSGLFRPIDPRSFIQTQVPMVSTPRFGDWRQINAPALVYGRTSRVDDGRLRVEFRLWDVFSEQQLAGFAYSTAPAKWRKIAHIIADAIYKRITGEDGYFDTRIVYVAESGPQTKRVKRLAIMDQDGENHRYLTDGTSLALTPRFSPSTQDISYLSYAGGSPRVLIRDIDSSRQEALGGVEGMTFSPRFSPDGEKLIFSTAKDGNTEIATLDMRTRAFRQLTNNAGIDTSPSFAPDGKEIVFNSDRGGSQQLYVMDAGGSNARRISHGQGRYFTPVWSPRGDLIAFTKLLDGKFSIGVMYPDGGGERILAEGYRVEGPAWAPNGRVLVFFRKDPVDSAGGGGQSRLYTIDLTGRNERLVPTPEDASDPAWSPLYP